jgi:hypothetical protein
VFFPKRKRNPYSNFFVLLISLLIAFIFLAFLGSTLQGCASRPTAYIKGGITTDVVGPDTHTAGLVELGWINTFYETKSGEFAWGPNIELLIFDSSDDPTNSKDANQAGVGVGMTMRYIHHLSESWNAYGGGGGVFATGYGNNADLADSPLYGTFFFGVSYKKFLLEIKHESSPFHGGSDGDIGVNFINFGYEWE